MADSKVPAIVAQVLADAKEQVAKIAQQQVVMVKGEIQDKPGVPNDGQKLKAALAAFSDYAGDIRDAVAAEVAAQL